MFRTLLRQWDLMNPLQALLGAIVLLETFSGRRTGDVLPKLWSTYVAFGNLTLFARHFLLHRPRLDGVGRLSRVRTNWSRTASSRKSVVLDCRTDCAVHGDLSPWLRYVMADGRGFDQPAPPRRSTSWRHRPIYPETRNGDVPRSHQPPLSWARVTESSSNMPRRTRYRTFTAL